MMPAPSAASEVPTPTLSAETRKRLLQAAAVVMTLNRGDCRTAADDTALSQALGLLALYKGRVVADAFASWGRAGCLRLHRLPFHAIPAQTSALETWAPSREAPQ